MNDTTDAGSALQVFLERNGLGQYFQAMQAEDIDLTTLKALDDADLKELGLSMGHRKALRQAIADQSKQASEAPEDQRRQVTIFFCDLVGSTELASRYDAEDMADIYERYHQHTAEVIKSYGGISLGTQGDGVVACFGYPKAAENDAERAVSAALAISRDVPRLSFADGLQLHSRIGVATGRVFVRGHISDSSALVGDTLNLASRLQDAAKTDTVVVGQNTQRLVEKSAETIFLEKRKLKGFTDPVAIWQIDRIRDIAERRGGAQASLLDPMGGLLGRDREVDQISGLWAKARSGAGQVLRLHGEPGIGKSQILGAAKRMAEADGATVISYYSAPGYENSALYPIRGEILRSAGLRRVSSNTDVVAQLKAWSSSDNPTNLRLLADLLALDPGPEIPPLDMTAAEQRQATYGLMAAQLQAQAGRGPLMILLEDAHWADPTTLEMLNQFIATAAANLPIMVIITHRPTVELDLGDHAHVNALELKRLSKKDSRALVARVMEDENCPPDILHRIIEASDGVPLFLEELSRSVMEQRESASDGMADVTVPITLEDSLMARLDRLSEGKAIVQTAAVFGRRFEVPPLRAVLPMEEAVFDAGLKEPVDAQIILPEKESTVEAMLFRHALVQQAAYEGLARKQRQQLHGRIADLLLEHQPHLAETEPETLARHFAGAGKFAEAINYLIAAGKLATSRAAQVEAANHYFAALEHLQNLPEGRDRDGQEVLLRALLGGALMATRGFAAPEVYDSFARARNLCLELGDNPMYCSCLYGLLTVEASRSNKDAALALAQEMMATFGECPVPSWAIAANFTMGFTQFFSGNFDVANTHFDRAIALYTPDQHPLLVEQFGDDLVEFSKCYRHWSHFIQGALDKSSDLLSQAEAMANDLNNKNSQTRSAAFRMGRTMDLGDFATTAKITPELVEISTVQGYPYWACAGQIGLGWSMACAGNPEGIAPITGSLAFFDMIGQRLPQAYWRVALVAAYRALGNRTEAIAAADVALDMARSGLDGGFEGSILHQKGRALMAEPADYPAAEACLREGLAIAQGQNAHLYAFQNAFALAELLLATGRGGEEGGVLADLLQRLSGGDEMAEVVRAREVLEHL